MATRTRKVEIEITEDRKGNAFKDTEKDAAGLEGKLRDSGRQGGKGLQDGVESGSSGLGDKLSGIGEKAGGALKSVLAVGGAAAGAALVVGLTSAVETEAATDKLAAQLGGSDWAMGMGEVAGDLYTQGWGDSVADTSEAVRQVLQSGLLPEDATNKQVEAMSADVLQLADVFDQDLGGTVNAVSQMIRTGMAGDGQEALDILARGFQQGNDKAGDLLDTVNEYSTNFRTLGLDGTQAMGLISQAVHAGARDSDQAADALKEFSIRAIDGSESTSEAFNALGLDAADMSAKIAAGGPQAAGALDSVLDSLRGIEDPLQRNQIAVALFGTQSEDMAAALGGMDLSNASDQMGNVAGALDKTDVAYDNASAKIETFKRQALDKLATFVSDNVIPAIEGLSNWAKENPGAFQAIAAVVGGVLVVAFIAWAASAASAAAATIAATWPIIAIVAAIALLVAGIIWAYQNWGWFRDACQAVADFVKGPLVDAFQWVWGVIQSVFHWVVDNWRTLVVVLGGPIAWAAALIITHFSTIRDFIAGVISWIAGAIGWVAGVVTGAFGWAAGVAVGAWNAIWGAVSWVRDAIVGAVGWVRDTITGAFTWASGVANTAFYGLYYAFDWVVDQIAGAVEWVKEKIAGVADAISNVPGAGVVKGLASHLPGFDVGGVVPGPVGSPQLAIVHGGETIFPTHNAAAMRAMAGEYTSTLTVAGGQSAPSGGGPVIVNVSMAGAVIGSEAEATRWVAKAWNKAAAEGAINVRGRRP